MAAESYRVRRRLCCVALACVAVVTAPACSDAGNSKASLAELLVKRYGGDLACVEAVLKQADASTTGALRDIAEHGFDVQKWTEPHVLDAFGRVTAC